MIFQLKIFKPFHNYMELLGRSMTMFKGLITDNKEKLNKSLKICFLKLSLHLVIQGSWQENVKLIWNLK